MKRPPAPPDGLLASPSLAYYLDLFINLTVSWPARSPNARTALQPWSADYTNIAMEDIPEFDLIAWSTDHSLKRRTTDALSRQDYSNKEVLLLMMPGDVAALDITGGQARLLCKALAELGNPADDGVQRDETQTGDQPGQDDPRPDSEVDPGEVLPRHTEDAGRHSHEEVLRAGEVLDRILRDSTASLQPAINVDGKSRVRPVVGSACTAASVPVWEGYDPHIPSGYCEEGPPGEGIRT